MKYQAPKSKERIEQVFVRLPKELQRPFWEAVNKSGTRPKELAVDMIKHCLEDMKDDAIRLIAGNRAGHE